MLPTCIEPFIVSYVSVHEAPPWGPSRSWCSSHSQARHTPTGKQCRPLQFLMLTVYQVLAAALHFLFVHVVY